MRPKNFKPIRESVEQEQHRVHRHTSGGLPTLVLREGVVSAAHQPRACACVQVQRFAVVRQGDHRSVGVRRAPAPRSGVPGVAVPDRIFIHGTPSIRCRSAITPTPLCRYFSFGDPDSHGVGVRHMGSLVATSSLSDILGDIRCVNKLQTGQGRNGFRNPWQAVHSAESEM